MIAGVQRGGAHPHQDLAVSGLRLRPLAVEHQPIETGCIPDFVSLHGIPHDAPAPSPTMGED
jgi:hypothetical protein